MRAYTIWTLVVLALSFGHDGMSRNSVTRLLILAYLGLTLWIGRRFRPQGGATLFIGSCLLGSLAVEFFYMFSRPVFPSLLFQSGDSALVLLHKTLVDWSFTAPAYVVIYAVFWRLLARYQYSLTEYVLIFSAGQALGDGNAFFMAQPAMLLLIPYVMLNYQAINVLPYLWVRDRLTGQARRGRWIVPLLVIPITYLVMGACIQVAGKICGWRP
ncbi:hypothetical protein JST97_28105 [bacterium]|nr:hypothetical protein [bacterium]